MAKYPLASARANYKKARVAKTAAQKGALFQRSMRQLFSAIPGVKHGIENALNQQRSEEIDLAFWNRKHAKGLPFFDDCVFVECKNWSTPMASQDVAAFIHKIEVRKKTKGIIISEHGITGDPTELSAANDKIQHALSKGIEIIVLLPEEILACRSPRQLVDLLEWKLLALNTYRANRYQQ